MGGEVERERPERSRVTKLDNASFLNIKSVYINIMSAHVVYYLTK